MQWRALSSELERIILQASTIRTVKESAQRLTASEVDQVKISPLGKCWGSAQRLTASEVDQKPRLRYAGPKPVGAQRLTASEVDQETAVPPAG